MLSWTLRGIRPHFYYEGESGGSGSGSGSGTSDGDGKNNGGNQDDKNGNGGQNSGNSNDDDKDKDKDKNKGKTFTQEEVNDILKKRLEDEKKKQEREAQEKQGEFQKLYEPLKVEHDALVEKYKTTEEENTTLKGILSSNLQAQIKDWPDDLKKAFPTDSSYEIQSKWVNDMTPVAKRLQGTNSHVNGEHGGQGNGSGSTQVVDNYMSSKYQVPNIPGVTETKKA